MLQDNSHWQKLANDGDEVCCRDADELRAKLDPFATGLPKRTEGRRSHHREAYCISNYLRALSTASLLDFPVKILKSEKPDFLLTLGDTVVGVEVTEAGTERSQRSRTTLARSPPGTLLAGEDDLTRPGKPLRGRGYGGRHAREIVVKLLLDAINKKSTRIESGDFKEADRYELLVWDLCHVNYMAESDRVHAMLNTALLGQVDREDGFRYSKISIWRETHCCIIYDVVNPIFRRLDVPRETRSVASKR